MLGHGGDHDATEHGSYNPGMNGRNPRRDFGFRCSRDIFTDDEIDILERYGGEFERLTDGRRLPTTAAQRRFIKVATGQHEPETVFERTWAKYLWRVEWESANESVMGERRAMPDDRDDWRRMSGAIWREIRRRARGLDD